MSKEINGAAAIVKCLEAEGISLVFGIPGATICPLYDALFESGIRHILVRHEQNAGHAASGYARNEYAQGKPAVCIATSGPGALNLITPIATAYMDSIPLIAITGQVSSELLGRDVFQEADITGAAEPFVKHSYLIKSVFDIPRVFKEAFHIAATGRQGPVLIDVPMDIQNAMLDFSYPENVSIRSYKPSINGHMGQIKRVLSALAAAKKPLLCAGGGVFSANAKTELAELANKCAIPVVTTMMGLSVISPVSPLFLGMIGMYGSETANHAMSEADVIILIGARVGDRAVMSPVGLSQCAAIIHIDIDPAEIGKNIKTDIPIVGDVKNILSVLIEKLEPSSEKPWIEKTISPPADILPLDKSPFINPHEFLELLMQSVSDNACIVADVGQNQIWAARSFCIKNGRFMTSGGMGTMGYALPCAMGVYLSNPAQQVVAVCGDGGFQMSMAELATIKANNINIKIIVLNNQSLGLVKEMQDSLYSGHNMGVLLDGNPDFLKLADSYGIKTFSIASMENARETLIEFLRIDEACLLECKISPEEKTV